MTIRRGVLPLLVLLALTGCSSGQPSNIQVGEVRRAPVTEVVEAPATIGARATATMRSPAQGTVKRLYVSEGQHVDKGQILATISSPQARDQLKQARQAAKTPAAPSLGTPGFHVASLDTSAFDRALGKQFERARTEARKIEDARARKQVLHAIGVAQAQQRAQSKALADITAQLGRSISGALSGMTSGLAASMSSLQAASKGQAKAAVKVAQGTVDALTIKAPFAGVVTLGRASGGGGGGTGGLTSLLSQLPVQPQPAAGTGTQVATGVPVSAGDAIVTVTDVSRLTLAANVDETDVLLVKPGTTATVELDAVPGATYQAGVTGIGVTPMEGTTGGVSYPVQLRLGGGTFDDGGKAPTPKPGMSAVTRLTVRQAPDAVAAPASAIVTSGRESVVWLDRNGTAERRVVKLGAQGEAVVQITEGLSVGDRIVVKGADSVRQGQALS
ncbi:efflux RND transporter periplasmic adaptor subunit [Nonomuraea sp. NPDC050536]|uniref:efflux RND transporter periplasmic adaptor subunit n=1 Tax=Nonomuraea sp. NPDC050536 TaxID=3364366 RepID=UPI0037C64BFA